MWVRIRRAQRSARCVVGMPLDRRARLSMSPSCAVSSGTLWRDAQPARVLDNGGLGAARDLNISLTFARQALAQPRNATSVV